MPQTSPKREAPKKIDEKHAQKRSRTKKKNTLFLKVGLSLQSTTYDGIAKKARKSRKSRATMGETIFKEEGKLVRPGRA